MVYNLRPLLDKVKRNGIQMSAIQHLPRAFVLPNRMTHTLWWYGVLARQSRDKDDMNTWNKGARYSAFMKLWQQHP